MKRRRRQWHAELIQQIIDATQPAREASRDGVAVTNGYMFFDANGWWIIAPTTYRPYAKTTPEELQQFLKRDLVTNTRANEPYSALEKLAQALDDITDTC